LEALEDVQWLQSEERDQFRETIQEAQRTQHDRGLQANLTEQWVGPEDFARESGMSISGPLLIVFWMVGWSRGLTGLTPAAAIALIWFAFSTTKAPSCQKSRSQD